MKKLVIVLPALNEQQVIGKVIVSLKQELKKIKKISWEIVVVDDGSRDNTAKIAKKNGARVLRHVINRGLGGALQTGFEYSKRHDTDFLITLDADGQHDPKDIKNILAKLSDENIDIVIGTRDINRMPWDRRIITRLSSFLTFIFFGVYCSDTQSGFRGFSRKAILKIRLKTQRMEVSSEFFHEIRKNKLNYSAVPIKVIYTKYSLTKGQSNLNSIKILLKLFLRLFR